MPIKSLNPYLFFNGTAGEAIALYQRALGATTDGVMRAGDVPGPTPQPEYKDRVVHCTMNVGGGVIMISDAMPDQPVAKEGNVDVCLHFDDVADMTRKFDLLAAGGRVVSALQDTFWGAKFGVLVDAYGVRWMFNCDLPKG
jgi:PhnB protein